MNRIGIFGGAFNPIHFGHINSILSVRDKMKLDYVRVIPAFCSPGKEQIETPTAEERLRLVELGFEDYSDEVKIDQIELNRKGVSYTIETIKTLKEASPEDELFLIIGLDQFEKLNKWKNFKEIFDYANLIVTSRPGHFFPLSKDSFPNGIKDLIGDFDGYVSILNNDAQIYFMRLEDMDISSSDIRKRIRLNQSIHKYVPLEVEQYIQEKDLYSAKEGVDYSSFDLSKAIYKELNDLGVSNAEAYDFRDKNQITDICLLGSAQTKKVNQTYADKIVEKLREDLGVKPIAVEGKEDGRWIVVDYGSVMVHLFYDFVRAEYNLEGLWKDHPRLSFT